MLRSVFYLAVWLGSSGAWWSACSRELQCSMPSKQALQAKCYTSWACKCCLSFTWPFTWAPATPGEKPLACAYSKAGFGLPVPVNLLQLFYAGINGPNGQQPALVGGMEFICLRGTGIVWVGLLLFLLSPAAEQGLVVSGVCCNGCELSQGS